MSNKNFLRGFRDNRGVYRALPAMMLANLSVNDQFGHEVDWSRFTRVPQVLVIAGRDAANAARDWGIFLQKQFNEGYQPTKNHLQSLSPREKVKIIAVAALPEVPSIFRGLFRNGFRKESPDMGVALDFGSGVSKVFAYSASDPIPKIAILPAEGRGEARIFSGKLDDEKLRNEIEAAVKATEGKATAANGAPVAPSTKQ